MAARRRRMTPMIIHLGKAFGSSGGIEGGIGSETGGVVCGGGGGIGLVGGEMGNINLF